MSHGETLRLTPEELAAAANVSALLHALQARTYNDPTAGDERFKNDRARIPYMLPDQLSEVSTALLMKEFASRIARPTTPEFHLKKIARGVTYIIYTSPNRLGPTFVEGLASIYKELGIREGLQRASAQNPQTRGQIPGGSKR